MDVFGNCGRQIMASEAQISYIFGLEKYAPGRVKAAQLSWGGDLTEMPKQEAAILLSFLIELKKSSDDKRAAGF
jgi:hypothetical protein